MHGAKYERSDQLVKHKKRRLSDNIVRHKKGTPCTMGYPMHDAPNLIEPEIFSHAYASAEMDGFDRFSEFSEHPTRGRARGDIQQFSTVAQSFAVVGLAVVPGYVGSGCTGAASCGSCFPMMGQRLVEHD
jgi:hypothetical protein